MDYSEKLRDPRWQKLAALVKERAGWKYERCGDSSSTLHAHHMEYAYGYEPWDYPPRLLECLCWKCHKVIERRLRTIRSFASGLEISEMERLIKKLITGKWKKHQLNPTSVREYKEMFAMALKEPLEPTPKGSKSYARNNASGRMNF